MQIHKYSIAFSLLVLMVAQAIAQADHRMNALKCLAGIWKMGKGANSFFEQWWTVSDQELGGKSYKLDDRDTIVFEQTKIVLSGNEINYIAKVKHQNQGREVAFRLISDKEKTFVFDNPDHDFPQRVIYQFLSADSLHAWVEGKDAGKERREDFYYSRLRKG